MKIGECSAADLGKTITITRETWQAKGRLDQINHSLIGSNDRITVVQIILGDGQGTHPQTVELKLQSTIECQVG
ncbi:MAG TPA: hypothetical protein VFE65_26035 [Pseudonocardia sp.]|jgi:hypothetical protein|nr:hypothetical protein [Pseudonocardia sp.]